MTSGLALVLTDLGLVEAELSLVMTTELASVLTVLGLVEAELSLVMTTELTSVLTVLGLVEAELSLVMTTELASVLSLSTTVTFNSVSSSPSLAFVCSTLTSVVGDAVSREVESPGLGAGDVAGVTVPRTVESPGAATGDVAGVTVPRTVESPGAAAVDVAGVTVPRTVESPGAAAVDVAVESPVPGALSSTCFSLGNSKVPSNCMRALDNLDWSKYEPVRWAVAMKMRMTTFISATC